MELLFANGSLISPSEDNAASSNAIGFNDRAFLYGDGVFETMRIAQGDIPMWGYHRQRLVKSQQVMGLALDDFFVQWQSFAVRHLSHIESACAKLVISRGEGPRGYKIPVKGNLSWWLQVTDLPNVSEQIVNQSSYRLTLCQHALSRQPALAGLKHLNRLDQVMARSEWTEQDSFDEGVMFNIDGDVIEGTMSNLFWLKKNEIYTPDLSQEGVDGCVRRWLIDKQPQGMSINIVRDVKLDELLMAEGVFLTNSLVGVKKVHQIDGHKIADSAKVDLIAAEFNSQFID
jgi:4-amino-4-deoxychorismate lyase